MEKLTEHQIQEYREAFQTFDKNGDGAIQRDELGMVMSSLGFNPSEEELQDLIQENDTDQSGDINFPEFCNFLVKHMGEEGCLRAAFKAFDSDGNGKISAEELRYVMDKLGENLTKDDIDEMIREADVNGDGVISYEEFVAMMTSGDKS